MLESRESHSSLNGYVAFHKGNRAEVYATTSLAAQVAAMQVFQQLTPRRRVQQHEVSVHLAELAGEPVTHIAVD